MRAERPFAGALALALCLGLGGAQAQLVFKRGGGPGGGGSAQSCDGGSSVCAQFQSGQTFVTWTDLATGTGGNDWRYTLYRSAAPINSGNYGSATLIASDILNNSGQLVSGDPASGSTSAYTQAYRQDAARPMSKLTDLGTALAHGTGLQVYTALASQNAYYAVVANSQTGGGDTYVGSVGPIAESVATPRAIQWASSTRQTYGQINQPTNNIPVILEAHQSNTGSGCSPITCQYGDYWQFWLPPDAGWQDGRPAVLDVLQDHGTTNYPGQAETLVLAHRDAIWNPLGTGSIETFHFGIGMTPNPLAGPANRLHRSTQRGIERMVDWALGYYGADRNQLHWSGKSMGAWGGANVGLRITSPRFSAVWLSHPMWRMDQRSASAWPGSSWTSAMPFKATVGTAPTTLGSTASSVLIDDGATWGGTGNYADTPAFIAATPGADLPATLWMNSKYDTFVTFSQNLDAKNAFQSARRGHAFVFFMGLHDTDHPGRNAIDCDWGSPDTGVCYRKADFKLNAPYIATTNSSIDDDPGTGGTTANGMLNGDYTGCINCGFKWTVSADTSSAFNFTIDNVWMDRAPTVAPTTTITGTMASSGGGTITVADASVFLARNVNSYFLVNGAEAITVTAISGNALTYTSRGIFGTTAQAHSSGETIRQFVSQPTGPNGGPYSSMTADLTPRRMQGFIKADGATINCTVTPNGEGSVAKSGTVTGAAGVFTLTGIKINASGATSVACL